MTRRTLGLLERLSTGAYRTRDTVSTFGSIPVANMAGVYTDLFFRKFVFVNNESTFAALRYDHFIANFKAELKCIT